MLLHKPLSAPSFGFFWKQLIGRPCTMGAKNASFSVLFFQYCSFFLFFPFQVREWQHLDFFFFCLGIFLFLPRPPTKNFLGLKRGKKVKIFMLVKVGRTKIFNWMIKIQNFHRSRMSPRASYGEKYPLPFKWRVQSWVANFETSYFYILIYSCNQNKPSGS